MHPPGRWGVLGEELLGDTGRVQPPTASQLEGPSPLGSLQPWRERAGLGGSAQAGLRGLSEQCPGNLRPVTNGPLAPPVRNLAAQCWNLWGASRGGVQTEQAWRRLESLPPAPGLS